HEARNALRDHSAVPSPFRVHDHDRPTRANPQALNLGAVAGVGSAAHRQAAVFQLFLERLPRLLTHLWLAAIGAQAQKDMPLDRTNAIRSGDVCKFFFGFIHQKLHSSTRPFSSKTVLPALA